MRKNSVFLFMLVISCTWNNVSVGAEKYFNDQQHRIIEVSGVGSVFSVPERFNLSIEQKGGVATQLNKAIVEKTNTVIQALIKIGVDKKAVQSLQVQFNPWIEYDGKTRE